MKTALLQMTSGDDPLDNLRVTDRMIRDAAQDGAGFIVTPEATNCISLSRSHQAQVLRHEAEDPTLHALRDLAAKLGVWVSIGSLALKTDDPDGRYANRGFIIGPNGDVKARYDKIHMFDVTLSDTESYAESRGYRPGDQAVTCDTPFGVLGLSICYDLRFPHLYRTLAQSGAQILLAPAAFAPATGRAHWDVLLRARAIECGAYVIAAAQTGNHPAQRGASRQTYGHSMAVGPWGDVIVDGGTDPGIFTVDLDPSALHKARSRMPSLTHDRSYADPK